MLTVLCQLVKIILKNVFKYHSILKMVLIVPKLVPTCRHSVGMVLGLVNVTTLDSHAQLI